MTAHSEQPGVFWGELSPCQHIVQIYEQDHCFLDALEGFVCEGFGAGESVIVIASSDHRLALEQRLEKRGIDLNSHRVLNQYIDLDTEATLSTFMVNGWPDDARFLKMVTGLMSRARATGRPVRAFGEMVAQLWARGDNAATIRLEHLWHTLCLSQRFSLFCAYPKSGFTQDATESIREICATHNQSLVQ